MFSITVTGFYSDIYIGLTTLEAVHSARFSKFSSLLLAIRGIAYVYSIHIR